jgi:hypothetical protein
MPQIRFRFDAEKLVQGLTFFAGRGVRDLDKMKAAKLLFHADKYHGTASCLRPKLSH